MRRYFVSLLFALALVPCALAATEKNVLFLDEGTRLMPSQYEISNEMYQALTGSNFEVQLFEEYLDTWRLNQDASRSVSALEAKYAGRKFDVVVAVGSEALKLLVEQPPNFLKGTPVVFLSVQDFNVPSALPANITGVTSHVAYAATARLAMSLQPGLQHLYYIESNPIKAATKMPAALRELAPFRKQLDIVTWQNVALDDLLRRVESLPPHSAILFDSYFKDPGGKAYTSHEVCGLVVTHANAPVYNLYQTAVGSGPVGGVVVNFKNVGKQGARIVLGLLAGAPVSQYPVERSATDVMIDWRKFQQFGFSEKNLPSSAIILFRSPTLWERYRWWLIAGGIVMLLQTLLIIELGLAGKRRKRSERTARELASRLIDAQEVERRRIAGELHDDVSQRLALVAIQLDTLRNSPPSSPNDLMREVSVLYDETDCISSDIHRFSHELHPAVLDRLGLPTALRRYCTEVSEHRKIAIHISTTGEERRISPAIALAFFRIGQECLTNTTKHSGAMECRMSLTYALNRIRLVVQDDGHGFDPDSEQAKIGLGIQSMRERLRSIGGSLSIKSSLRHGTSIIAEAPIRAAAPLHSPGVMFEERASRAFDGVDGVRRDS